MASGYRLLDPEKLKELAKEWEGRKLTDGLKNLGFDYIINKGMNRKIRIGYLSTDFCNHPVGRFMLPILENHNNERFSIIGIQAGAIEDDLTNKLKANRFLDILAFRPHQDIILTTFWHIRRYFDDMLMYLVPSW